jgi:hypothetical protein
MAMKTHMKLTDPIAATLPPKLSPRRPPEQLIH